MPVKSGVKTPQERKFIQTYVDTGSGVYAAKEARYSQPATAASKALARPAIQAAIREEQTARLNNELLPLAVGTLQRILTDPKAPAGAAVQAAKLVLDRTLGSQEGGRKEVHEMSGEELQRAIDALRREASARAQPVIDGQAVEVDAAPEPGVFD